MLPLPNDISLICMSPLYVTLKLNLHRIFITPPFLYCMWVFGFFVAVTFLEYWKRKNASLAHHWDCLEFEIEEVFRT